MAAIGFIYAWQKLYPVLIFRSVILPDHDFISKQKLNAKMYEMYLT